MGLNPGPLLFRPIHRPDVKRRILIELGDSFPRELDPRLDVETIGFRNSFVAESLTRAQCSSRSGVTPSNARAPSNTTEHSQAACVRGPMIGTLPSCHFSSKYVQVLDQPSPAAIQVLLTRIPGKDTHPSCSAISAVLST